jgi:hypothetical protein
MLPFELAQQGHGTTVLEHWLVVILKDTSEATLVVSISSIREPLEELSNGTILLKDECRALRLARLSAITGSSFGQYVEGLWYQQGKGFPEDDPREKASHYANALSLWTRDVRGPSSTGIGKCNAVLAKSSRITHDLNHSSGSPFPCFID